MNFGRVARGLKKILNHSLRVDFRLLRRGRGREDYRYPYQKNWVQFDIRPGDKVLDLGSGGDPFPLATHLADAYEGDTTHRAVPLARDGRPFTSCDVAKLPFADREFDYVYCAHVLEHVLHPGAACREIMRVGRRGFIETPTKTSDIMFNFCGIPDHHRWHIEALGDLLIFMQWKKSECRDLGISHFLGELHSHWSNPFQELVHRNRDLFVNFFVWEGRFRYLVIGADGQVIESSL